MISSVEEYLGQLKKEMVAADRAVIQDALSDAEEYLRNAMEDARQKTAGISEADALPGIVAEYGGPEEVAAAYLKTETRFMPRQAGARRSGRSPAARFFGVLADPRAWGALLYLLLSLATGIIYFTWAVTGISLSLGLLVLVVGIPFLILFLLSVRAMAFVEGRLAEALLGVRMPRRPRFFDQSGGWGQKIKSLFAERITWTTMVYDVVQLPLGVAYFVIAATLIGIAAYFIALPLTSLVFDMPSPYVIIGDTRYQATNWAMPLFVIGGVLLLTGTMHLARIVGRVHGKWVKIMLVSQKG